ncbi:hypothetical protein PM10SUCC1_33020 [Propionigenium maris DSM 9537]|uniref:Uncharacterized protein n=1 Tax=Propionigenium maris DSM 9537 TaxID=1123000 RepID=A0A9W6GMG5_9FUSO|nr:hypothetical protein [Propionigenium maris]GLI57788.1 hypothetical protein PM10SUCC1_33020 [Propionigenium maris DSM 9537]
MTELQVLRWFENPEPPECHEDTSICYGCRYPVGECDCRDDWKLED